MNDNPKIIKNASKVNASCSDTFYFPMTVLNKLDQIAREKGVTTEQLIIQFVEKGLNQESSVLTRDSSVLTLGE